MNPVHVLMIDDCEDDAELLSLVFAAARPGFRFTYTLDADEGLARIRSRDEDVRLVLLDLKMPGRNGKDVLAEIRRSPAIGHVPVVIFSSSDAAADVRDSYELGANAYVRKPSSLDGYRAFVSGMHTFWLDTARLP